MIFHLQLSFFYVNILFEISFWSDTVKRGPYSKGILMKRKILSASAKIFLEKGYAGTSSKMVSDLVGVSNGSPFFHYGNKEGVLLEMVKWMFAGQFRTAEQLLGDVSDPLMLYGMETSLQMHIAELSEPLRELYVTAYTLPLTSAYINEGMVEKLSAIFSDFLPGAERKDWFACELATAGIMRSYTTVPCTADYPMAEKLRNYLSCCYKIFDVPKERYEPVIERVARIDLTETARSIIDETVREVDAGYEAAMAGLDAPNAVGG